MWHILFYTAATTLTGLHFAMTTIMTLLFKWLGYIQPSHLPVSNLIKFVLFANLSIVGMNVSLMWNSVGFYQVCSGQRLWVLSPWIQQIISWDLLLWFVDRLLSCAWFQYHVFSKLCLIKFITQGTQSSA